MHLVSKTVCWLTLWVDACLLLGVLFTHTDATHSVSASMAFGAFTVSSLDRGGSFFILAIAAWTAVLAIFALRRDSERKKKHAG
ncbi:MAG: hypothetical protein JF599_00625 [Verrucomicrobia bacterium]|nr:hypothetical protein [Verrucomicrobiota bacterium]